jgi:Trk K+ transport system NAD-binding subunit
MARLLTVRRLLAEGHENIFVLASVLLLFQGCNELVSHSGILAVTVAGVVVGNIRTAGERDLREFKDQLSVLLIGLLFVMLAADVRYEQVADLGRGGLAVVAALVLVVRPLVVLICTAGTNLSLRERLFVAWIAPRGIVAAAVASLVSGSLESNGIPGGPELRALVFLTIAATVLLAGVTAAPVGNLLGVRLPGRDSTAILGAHALGLALANELRGGGTRVIFLDANPHGCRRAEEAGYTVTFGNALEERTLQRARFELVQAVVALTTNQTVNGVFVGRARDLFQVPEGYMSAERAEEGIVSELVRKGQAQVLFDGPHDVERWDVRERHGGVVIEHRVFDAEEVAEQPPEIKERLVLLSVRRGDLCKPMTADFTLRDGDVVAVAIHEPDRNEAEKILVALGLGAPSHAASVETPADA